MTTTTLRARVRGLSADLSALTDDEIDFHAEASVYLVSVGHFGTAYDIAWAYATAHFASRTPSGSGASTGVVASPASPGAATSVAAARLRVGYGSGTSGYVATSATDADLMTTTYGRMYLQLRDSRAGVLPSMAI